MTEMFNSPLFGVFISIITFEFGLFVYKKTKISFFNPLLISVVLIIGFMLKFNIPFDAYNKGGNLINFFLGPATIILAVPLYKQFTVLKANFLPVLIGITAGSITSILSVLGLSRLFGLSDDMLKSLVPKSITTPIGLDVSNQLGGIPSITMTAILITGILGAIIGPMVCKVFKIKDEVAAGTAMGTAAHAVGTTKAMEMGETEGAMSGVAIGIAGIITVLLASFL